MALALQAPEEKALEAAPVVVRHVNFESEIVVREGRELSAEKLTSDQRAIMNERLDFVRRVYQLCEGGESQADAVAAVATHAEKFPILSKSGKGGTSALTVYNYRSWKKRIKRKGRLDFSNAVALADRYSCNVRGAAGCPEFWQTFNAFYLTEQRLSVSESYRLAKRMCVKNSIGPIPEEHRVRYWLKNHADKSALLAARYGEEAFKNKAMSYIRRDWSNVEVNEMWVGDHHVFDVFVKSRDDDKQKWVAVRPWLTGWLDAKSLYFTGACIRVEEPNHVAILTALQNGILCSGGEVPEALYIDNGKDFLKAGAGEVWTVPGTEYEHGVCKELGIGTVKKSLPYNARAKLIERIFKEVCERFSRRWAQYLGNRPDARPEAAGYFQKNPEELPSLHEFSVQFQKFLDEEYHRTCQNGKILSGRCPADAWKLKPEKRKLTEKELWFSMLVPYTKNTPKVGRGAAVQIEKREYKSDVLWNYFGEKIMVKQDTVNGGNPQAFELSGKYICELEEIDLVPAFAKTAEDRKKISEGMKQQRQEVKRAFGIANEMSKGMRTVAAQDVLQLGGGPPRANNSASPVKVGSRRSVKGSTHNFEHYRIAPGGDELSRGEEKKQKLEAFDNECGMQAEDAGISDSDSIAEFHKHITSSKRETDPEDWPTGWIS